MQLFTHIHYVRLVFVSEDAPECAAPVPEEEWLVEPDRERIAKMTHDLARGYHHGQIKLALKLAGQPMSDDEAGPVSWYVWFRKTAA